MIPVGSPEQMRDIDWPVLRMWSIFDPAFPVGPLQRREGHHGY